MEPEEKTEDTSDFFDDVQNEKPTFPVTQQLFIVALFLLILLGTGYAANLLDDFKDDTTQVATVPYSSESIVAGETADIKNEEPFENINISAKSAFVWDVKTQKVLYQKEADTQLPLASITKLMTALLAHELAADNEKVKVSLGALLQDGESGLKPGETFSLETLTDLTLMSSSNDGAFAIAETAGSYLNKDEPAKAFVQAMNIRAEEMGLSQTYFKNPTGLDITETDAGAYGSARDIAFLMEYILSNQPSILERTTDAYGSFYNTDGSFHNADNTNQFVYKIPGLLGSKTGYTTLAGGNLTIAFDAGYNRPVIVVVLDSTYQGRFNDVLLLTEAARSAVQ